MNRGPTTPCLLALVSGALLVPIGFPDEPQECDQLQQLWGSDTSSNDDFGFSVSISDDRLVVGALYNDELGEDSGAAYVFRRDDHGTPAYPLDDLWVEEAKLTPTDPGIDDRFGHSVCIYGDRVIAEASFDDDACPQDPACNSGSAYILRRNDNATPDDPSDDSWTQEAKLTASDGAAGHRFGVAVSLGEGVAVMGAYCDGQAGSCSGSAYVFRLDDNGTPLDETDDFWREEAKLVASDAAESDHFGGAVGISADRVVVGAFGKDDPATDSGAAYIFDRHHGGVDNWGQVVRLIPSDGATEDRFGSSVALSGDVAIVGAYRDDDAGDASGSAYLFALDDNGTPSDPNDDSWPQVAKLLAPDAAAGDSFGGSVALSEESVVVGGHARYPGGSGFGAAYVFRRDDNGTASPLDDLWHLESKLTSSGENGDYFGYSVGVSGHRAVVGAWQDDTAYVFPVGGDDCDDNGLPDDCESKEDCNQNDVQDFCDIANGTSDDCTENGIPDECEPDCNVNALADSCDIAYRLSEDCTCNGIPDECEPDCNSNGIADSCDIAAWTSDDCNYNGVPDACDITGGASEDCNYNGVPDECEQDCNYNGVPDDCDVADPPVGDCDANGVPDACDPDCNYNGVPDACDISRGISEDCDSDGIPDECEADCNENSIPDDCDIAAGTSFDLDESGIADECENWPACIVGEEYFNYEPHRGDHVAEYMAIKLAGELRAPDDEYNRIHRDLGLIVDSYPELATIRHRPDFVLDQLIVRLSAGGEPGYHALNSFYQVVDDREGWSDPNRHVLTFCDTLNIPLVVPEYEAQAGVVYAEPNWYGGDGDNIILVPPVDTTYRYQLSHGFGDCPAGCICRQLWTVNVDEDGTVVLESYLELGGSYCRFVDPPVIYVDRNASGQMHDGSSWCTAFLSLQDALVVAFSSDDAFTEIRVAAGTYTPDQGALQTPGDREASFVLWRYLRNVTLRGGYAGCTALYPDERDIAAHETILSGDLNGDDGPDFTNISDNSYHVIESSEAYDTTIVDGFTISGGNADGSAEDGNDRGGGIYNTDGGGPSVTNCLLHRNRANALGGGIGSDSGAPTIRNCIFRGNTAGGGGGGMSAVNTTSTLVNCLFVNNSTASDGGALHSDTSTISVTNCTFSGNTAASEGGGIHISDDVQLTIANTILWANGGADEVLQVRGGTPVINYTCLQGWTGALGGIGNTGDDPAFVDIDGADNVVGTEDDNLRLQSSSPCIDAGDNEALPEDSVGLDGDGYCFPAPIRIDLDGEPRFLDDPDTVDSGNGIPPVVDMGAYEYEPPCLGAEECSDGLYCTGEELCTDGVCHPGISPCLLPLVCREDDHECVECLGDAQCLDDNPCNGTESCGVAGNCIRQIDADCNGNEVEDYCDIAGGASLDSNENGIPDDCELGACCTSGTSCGLTLMADCPDGIWIIDAVCDPDPCPQLGACCLGDGTCVRLLQSACDTAAWTEAVSCNPGPCPQPAQDADESQNGLKNRYVTFTPNNVDINVAIRVELTSGPGPLGTVGWVGMPVEAGCPNQCSGAFVSHVVSAPVFRAWTESPIHLGDCEIAPVATYEIRTTVDGVVFTNALAVETIHKPGERFYGDVVGLGTGDLPPMPGFTPANGVVNVTDVQAYILTVQGSTSPSAHTTWVDLHGDGPGSPPNFIVNVSDLQRIKFGFEGQRYTDAPDQLDPADCP